MAGIVYRDHSAQPQPGEQTMTILAPGISYGDLDFLGRSHVIATALLQGPDGIAIVDPGPSSTLPVLRRLLASIGAEVRDVTALLLTHIHLDHAGATGTLLREQPHMRVLVHELGAKHLVDPSRLLASATRLYGDDMDRLWGEVAPVPQDVITSLTGGERIDAGGRSWQVAYTPGHASHHVSYFNPDSGLAFVGDTAGVQIVRGGFVLPPTPPPDIDFALWRTSLSAIESWRPDTLFLTHFGPTTAVTAHLSELRDHLQLVERLGSAAMAAGTDDSTREAHFITHVRDELRHRMPEADVVGYEVAGRFDLNWRGIERYLRKRG
jgi:glyoxylase-like metal-dependent hydrolase (beta-lactamase superfamily II)